MTLQQKSGSVFLPFVKSVSVKRRTGMTRTGMTRTIKREGVAQYIGLMTIGKVRFY
jgi:hypothetical protein